MKIYSRNDNLNNIYDRNYICNPKSSHKENLGTDCFAGKFYKHLRR